VIEGVRFDERGLAPAIVQDADTSRVLMLGYVNEASLRLTESTGEVHFWSRSRAEMWHKGATSGNRFHVVDTGLDCDGDAVLFRVHPDGPACHEGTTSCFDVSSEKDGLDLDALDALWAVIRRRAGSLPEGSYTAQLISQGVDGAGRKIVEEATEVLLAARDHAGGGPAARVDEEAADLIYHLFVLLAERGLDPAGAMAALRARAS
jgi:phosphoribosyl-ATP pyrophosphohydrolase/phosphoribosyl-AMP cyclohydrolase